MVDEFSRYPIKQSGNSYFIRASSARVFAGLAEALGTAVLPATSVPVRFPLPPTSGNGCWRFLDLIRPSGPRSSSLFRETRSNVTDRTAPPLKRRDEARLERENQVIKRQQPLTLSGGNGKRRGTDTEEEPGRYPPPPCPRPARGEAAAGACGPISTDIRTRV